ncbi:MAG: nucleotidyltransferase domain-containing protein [Patescibacteria group bacterium]
MNAEMIQSIVDILQEYPEIKYAYLFGSQVGENAVPLSDIDIAVYVVPKAKPDFLLEVYAKLSPVLKKNDIDLIDLADPTLSPLLKYNVVKEGLLLFEREPYRLQTIPAILNIYFDTKLSLHL